MPKPLIGISANEKPISNDIPIVHLSSSRNFADGVRKAGGLPVYLPVTSEVEAGDYINAIDALILTGGQDIDPSFYGQTPLSNEMAYFPDRDRFELALLLNALKMNKPVLAVCRGMQLVNVLLGGDLYQDIPNHSQGLPLGTYHHIEVKESSQIATLFQTGSSVNSVHHQAIRKLGRGLIATAHDSRDGIIEAIELVGYPLLAVQWHPEFLIEESPNNQALFDYLVKKV